MQEFHVIIPDEHYQLINFRHEALPGIGVINSALQKFEPKEVFSWHLSIMIHFDEMADNGMPSHNEMELLKPWEDKLDGEIKGADSQKPNALFLARITWNETRELIYRIFNPEPVNDFLQQLINSKEHLRPFDFRIASDPIWKLANWHLNTALNSEQNAAEQSASRPAVTNK